MTESQHPSDKTQKIIIEESAELDMPLTERFAAIAEETEEPIVDDNVESQNDTEVFTQTHEPPHTSSEKPIASSGRPDNTVPLYSTQYVPPQQPTIIRPQGPSVATIILGIITLLIGGGTVAVGVAMSSDMWPSIYMQDFTAYAFAGIGVLLCIFALVWGIGSYINNRRKHTSAMESSKGGPID